MTGSDLIASERQRQIVEEGYGAEHDAGHADELARAGSAYASTYRRDGPPSEWPWDADYWKPTPNDRIRELVKAGALIAAAIDSLIEGSDPASPEPALDVEGKA